MKNLRLFAGLCAALTMASVLSACGDTAAAPSKDTEAKGQEGTAAIETEEVAKRPPVNLPDGLDFGGATFNSITFEWQGYKYYFFADEENGDIMNDAIYHRRQAVEDKLNVKLSYEMLGNDSTEYVPNAVKKTVLGGEDVYQQALFHCIGGIATMASSGYLYNLDDMPYLDLKAEWWNQEQMDVLRLGKNTYYAVNDYMIPCPYICYFNKEMVQRLDYENPYDLVYQGKWTLDKFIEMARGAVSDLNGDGKIDFENDSFGISSNETSKYISFMTGSGQFITEKGADGHIALAINTPKTQSIMERFTVLADEKVCYIPSSQDEAVQLTINSGRLMFQLNALSSAEMMRDYTVDFGFLPYPKYDEAQERYYSMDWGGLMGVPTTITNPEMVGAVTELLAYESGNEVIPTYYQTVLTGKLARDEDAEKMLDIIFDTICYEVGGNYFGFSGGFNELFYSISNLALKGNSDFASFYAKKEKTSNKTIDKFYADLENVEE